MWFPGAFKLLMLRIRYHRRRRNQVSALRAAQRYVRLRRSDPAGWWYLGDQLLSMERLEEAEKSLREAVSRFGDNMELMYLLSDCLCRQSRIEEAEELANLNRQKHPDSALPWLALAVAAYFQRDVEEVLRLGNECAKRASDPWSKKELANHLMAVPSGRLEAKRLLREVADAWERDPELKFLLGLILETYDDPAADESFEASRRLARMGTEELDQMRADARERLASAIEWFQGAQRGSDS